MIFALEVFDKAGSRLVRLSHLNEQLSQLMQGDALLILKPFGPLMALGGLLPPVHLLVAVAHGIPHSGILRL